MPVTSRARAALLLWFAGVAVLHAAPPGPSARVSEETRTLTTYGFSDPNPVPILTRDPRLYPYHSFEGYESVGAPREWKVITLENEHIEVFVLPEVGGKVWGARVKSTGHEFIYRNEVLEFRNIALRGPWTSGGIEFNFGVIGHTPATATPVDYLIRENPDGSVSCIVGTMDLPSRTQWRVEIRLPADKAYFETRVLWHNPTSIEQPYYNWMTAAAFASDDLEMSIPGNAYLRHSGAPEPWPTDEAGRFLPLYRNNRFGTSKSYHVVGELNDFFGGYYHEADYGFGHWARYEDMPGQKLWLWALSRSGGIWEDLLTDTDGQYVEFQAGRLFVQYSPGDHVNPITQAAFDPLATDRWTETWFPLEGIGGLTDASREGAMSVRRNEASGRLEIGVNAFSDISGTLRVWSGTQLALEQEIELTTLEPFETSLPLPVGVPFRVQLAALDLDYASDPSARELSRPFDADPAARPSIPQADRWVLEGLELKKARRYESARALFESALADEPWHRDGLLAMADLEYRRARYEEGLEYAVRALRLDAYDAEANFVAGILHRARDHMADSRDAFGWAARSTAYRSGANVQLAELALGRADLDEAERYAKSALDYDRFNLSAWELLALVSRGAGDPRLAAEATKRLLELDPLAGFALAEAFLANPTKDAAAALQSSLRSEYPDQTLLELVIGYANRGMPGEAITLLEAMADRVGNPLLGAWLAYLQQDPARLDDGIDANFVFPYRRETLPVLDWAAEHSDRWSWDYLLALNLWALDRPQEALARLRSLGDAPELAAVYVARADLDEAAGGDPEADLRRAVDLDGDDRTLRFPLIEHFQERGQWADALEASTRARERFPTDFNLDLVHSRSLLHLDRPLEVIEILDATHVLPSEHARGTHEMYVQAHGLAALDAMEAARLDEAYSHLSAALSWPEHLGQGRPYEPEERLIRYLMARVDERRGRAEDARRELEAVVAATKAAGPDLTRLDLLAIQAAETLGRLPEMSPILLERASILPAGDDLRRSLEVLARAEMASGAELAAAYPRLFQDLDGGLLIRALSLSDR